MSSMITTDLVSLDTLRAADKHDAIRALAAMVQSAGRTDDAEALAADAWTREQKSATGMPGGVAIPHCRTASVQEPTLAFARLPEPLDFGAKDGPADLAFFIAAPDGADSDHLKILSALARSLVRKDFVASLREAEDAQSVVDLIGSAVDGALKPKEKKPADEPAPAGDTGTDAGTGASSGASAGAGAGAAGATSAAAQETTAGQSPAVRRLVAVTACPTGIAHTYMAADALALAAEEMGVEIEVETQGSSGSSKLSQSTVNAAEAVIFAADVDVRDKQRFAGKPVIAVPVKRGVDEPQQLIERALRAAKDPHASVVTAETGAEGSDEDDEQERFGKKVQRVLMTGVSYMIPFVAAGGLLIALGFLLGGYNITDVADDIAANSTLWNLPAEADLPDPFRGFGVLGAYLGSVFFVIGGVAMGFLVPALAGYIAYGMADRPGIAPGFIAGSVAAGMDAGFIGGIVGGVLAGAVAYWIKQLSVPRWLAGLMPVVIIPLVATIISSGLLYLFLGGPIAALTGALESWLSGMTGTAAILLGIVLGLMMCADLGGPINKVAYSFAVAGLGAGSIAENPTPFLIMAAVMASGMVPPLGLALATFVDRKLFTVAERENGKTAVLLGAAFISEGAIPFAAADPLRVLPAAMLGGMTTGALTMAFDVTSQAPHGGAFVFFAIDSFALFALSVVIGAVVTATVVVLLKRFTRRTPEGSPAAVATASEPQAAAVA
ncbi:PTS fructose transporter subunit IIABC [Nesterenkonia aerolata]|uniref:Fructose-specific PTS transporter subunit EIIC n=1 Tax=Nesterenkonia aerolata TaxID=3074079 RepID=A0ABU2DQK3_9MICC|nr:fructose-specific PTS transporter subunit EIIC [Nesterenkonia sp. LY-0111]MDR8018743.1 fructose-specific PTS transporter subunit EIIC [Nesterenkonia sp. LY-0111]